MPSCLQLLLGSLSPSFSLTSFSCLSFILGSTSPLFCYCISLNFSSLLSSLLPFFPLFSRFFFFSSLRVCLHEENLKKLFKTKRVVDMWYPASKRGLLTHFPAKTFGLPTHFPSPKNIYCCFPANYERGMYGISGFIYALSFLPSFCVPFLNIIFGPNGLRGATLTFLKHFHALCICCVA